MPLPIHAATTPEPPLPQRPLASAPIPVNAAPSPSLDRLLVLLPTDFAGVATPRPASDAAVLSVAGAASPDLPDSSSSICSTTGLGEPRPPLLLFPRSVTAATTVARAPDAVLPAPVLPTARPRAGLAGLAYCHHPHHSPTVAARVLPRLLVAR
nr:predicted GPI-anchored protein 58 [Aegilops tauschii subsp. strangulata]